MAANYIGKTSGQYPRGVVVAAALVLLLAVGAFALMRVDIASSPKPIEKELDAKAFLETK